MPPRDATSEEATRQQEQSKVSEAERGHRPQTAKPDGAAATDKTRRMKGK